MDGFEPRISVINTKPIFQLKIHLLDSFTSSKLFLLLLPSLVINITAISSNFSRLLQEWKKKEMWEREKKPFCIIKLPIQLQYTPNHRGSVSFCPLFLSQRIRNETYDCNKHGTGRRQRRWHTLFLFLPVSFFYFQYTHRWLPRSKHVLCVWVVGWWEKWVCWWWKRGNKWLWGSV